MATLAQAISEGSSTIDPATTPANCPTCGRWRALKIIGATICGGCNLPVPECYCKPLAQAA